LKSALGVYSSSSHSNCLLLALSELFQARACWVENISILHHTTSSQLDSILLDSIFLLPCRLRGSLFIPIIFPLFSRFHRLHTNKGLRRWKLYLPTPPSEPSQTFLSGHGVFLVCSRRRRLAVECAERANGACGCISSSL
jgi:hypothetical protein